MVREHPIICPHCKKESGWTSEGLMYYCITEDLLCRNCNKVVIHANKFEAKTESIWIEASESSNIYVGGNGDSKIYFNDLSWDSPKWTKNWNT